MIGALAGFGAGVVIGELWWIGWNLARIEHRIRYNDAALRAERDFRP